MVQALDFGWNPPANLLFLPPSMRVIPTELPGVLVLEPIVHRDPRGFFLETYHAERFEQAGIPGPFVQDNVLRSRRGVLRGLHFETRGRQGKLVSAVSGEVFDVAVDLRPESPTFAQWFGIRLSGDNHHQLYVPVGFAHGFCVLSETADVTYLVSSLYDPETEAGIRWDDPEVGVEWPVSDPLLSQRDIEAPLLADLADSLPW